MLSLLVFTFGVVLRTLSEYSFPWVGGSLEEEGSVVDAVEFCFVLSALAIGFCVVYVLDVDPGVSNLEKGDPLWGRAGPEPRMSVFVNVGVTPEA